MVDLYVILDNKIIALFLDESNQTKHGLTSIKEILVLVQMPESLVVGILWLMMFLNKCLRFVIVLEVC